MLLQIPDSDWRDGFLFLGNQLSLDFLNTRPVMDGGPVELLPDGAALTRWLAAAGLSPTAIGGEELARLRGFREEYRSAIIGLETGARFEPGWVDRLNALLAEHPYVDAIAGEGLTFRRERRFPPGDVWGPLLDSVADLVASADPAKVRKCAACVLHFLDTSKKGTRRWCSMRLCGNRYKVAEYAKRKRSTPATS